MVTRIIEFCAKNRAIVFLGVAFALAGAVLSIHRVKLDAIPDLSDPQVIIFTEWMGRSPTLIEDQVTYPIVSSLVAAPHIRDVRGFSMFGMSFIYVIFEEGTDIYWARSRVLEYLSSIRGRLPEGVNPVIGPDATGIGWVFQYTLVDKSGQRGLDALRTYQDFTLRYLLASLPGVAEVASVGGYQKQYQVTVNPDRLRAYDVTLDEVLRAIRDSNNDVGGRIIEMAGREVYVRGRGYIQDLGAIERIAVRTTGPAGTPILVRHVADVRLGPDIRRGLLEWNGEGEAVGAIVVMRYGENALDVIDRVKRKIAELKAAKAFPDGVEIEIAYDRSDLIHRSITTLKHALLEEAIVVALVILIFLLHVRSSLLPILSLPLAVALAFIPMVALDIPSTIMSLGGIAIAIGATVDAEIVMIEASHKKLEHAPPGADRDALLAEAAREVTPAIFFSLVIIAVAFLPVFALEGQAGRLFKPLAYTKTFVMLTAAILSITFAPALRNLLLRGKIRPESRHPISRFIIRHYKPFVFVALRRPISTIAIGVFALASAVPLALKLGSEFMPPLNEGDVLYMPITFPNISIEEAKRQLQVQDRVLKSFPEVHSVFGKIGRVDSPTDPAPLTMVETTVRLKPEKEWRKLKRARWYSSWSPEWLKAALRKLWPEESPIAWEELTTEMNKAMHFPGWTNAITMPIKTRVDMLTTGVRTPIGIKIPGKSLEEIEKIGIALEGLISPIRGTRSVIYERNLGGLYLDIIPKDAELARYGLRIGDLQRTIEAAIGGTPITVTIEGRNRFTVNVRYPQDLRSDRDRLEQILIPLQAGGGSGNGMTPGMRGALEIGDAWPRAVLAQNMSGMSGSSGRTNEGAGGATGASSGSMSDVSGSGGSMPMPGSGTAAKMSGGLFGGGGAMPLVPTARPSALPALSTKRYIPLGRVADVKIVGGPPMIRDEQGLLVGYVYIDIDAKARDIGGYVNDAKKVVNDAIARGALKFSEGHSPIWTGQYELLEKMSVRMKIVIPITLAIVIILLFLHFKNFIEVLIVLLSIPFALIGSVWLLWALDYRLSTAVYVGIIALVGLATQTGIVMIVYIDNAYARRKAAGKIRDLSDIIWAHMEGTVLRVRPKLMTVATMLIGLIPLLWATGSGADVMKRIAAPMVGGLITSAFLTLEIIPVIYTYWRQEQVLWERLAVLDPRRLFRLKIPATILGATLALNVAAAITHIYVDWPDDVTLWTHAALGFFSLASAVDYLDKRPAAKHLVWPARAA
ncbi:MAG: efflux RND transporter permease subunit [Deltaproteobacteria bacterium]|nr:efflux RND transporter permease subunit [Deltaproteobacteria bacterium]